MRPKTATVKPKAVMALTGTYPCNIDDKTRHYVAARRPRPVRRRRDCAGVARPDQCLWLTDPAHQERLAERLEHSPAVKWDVRVFKRPLLRSDGKDAGRRRWSVAVSDRLTAFAGLSQEVVLVGIDDHFEIWDAARVGSSTPSSRAPSPPVRE